MAKKKKKGKTRLTKKLKRLVKDHGTDVVIGIATGIVSNLITQGSSTQEKPATDTPE